MQGVEAVPSIAHAFTLNLVAASFPKEDARRRPVDLHALRHTFGTHLSKNGVAPRTAQAAMRHSSLHLTMKVYTNPTLLDVAGALEALPDLGVEGRPSMQAHAAASRPLDNSGVAPVHCATRQWLGRHQLRGLHHRLGYVNLAQRLAGPGETPLARWAIGG